MSYRTFLLLVVSASFASVLGSPAMADASCSAEIEVEVTRTLTSGLCGSATCVDSEQLTHTVPSLATLGAQCAGGLLNALASWCSAQLPHDPIAGLQTREVTAMMSVGPGLGCPQAGISRGLVCVQCRVHEEMDVDSDPPVNPDDTEFFAAVGISSAFGDFDEAPFVELGGAARIDRRTWLGLAASYEAPSADLFEADITHFDVFVRRTLSGKGGERQWFLRGGVGWSAISARVETLGFLETDRSLGADSDSLTAHAGTGIDWPTAERFRLRTEATVRYLERPEEVELRVGLALAFR